MNFFVYKSVAERYARYRPYFHPFVIGKIKTYLNIQTPIRVGVDVGCGFGQSTVALKEIAALVIGTDISAEMLRFANRQVRGLYFVSAKDILID